MVPVLLARILGILALSGLIPAQTSPSQTTPAQTSPIPTAPTPTIPAKADLAPALHELSLNHLAEADRLTRATLGQTPSDPSAHFLLGLILFREQRPTDSLAAYTAGARIRTPAAPDLEVVASDYILLNDLPDAEKWLRYATTLNPSDPHLWYLLGRTEYNEDRSAEAVLSLQRCLQLAPRDLRAEYNLGLAFEKLQRPADAIAAYRTAIAWQAGQPAQDPQPYLDLGTLLLTQGHPADALPLLQQAARFGPANPLIFQEQGLALEALGRYNDAIPALQRAATLAPDSEQPHFFLGRIFRRLGRTSEANTEYSAVARILGAHSSTPTPNPEQPAAPSPSPASATQNH